jgi:ferric-dicitrate binding protein FerR (iron transport regulator)
MLIRYLNNECLPGEKDGFEQMLKNDEQHRKTYEEWRSIWHSASFDLPQTDPGSRFAELKYRVVQDEQRAHKKKARQRFMRYTISIAASLLVFATVALNIFYAQSLKKDPVAWITKEVSRGQKSQLQLADGTLILINSDSKLSYPEYFDEKERLVKLDGEAFFEVAKDTIRPFRVISGDVVTEVLGTSFNVQAYDVQDKIEVFVRSGRVAVSLNNNALKSVKLHPNDVATYNFSEGSINKSSTNNADRHLSWKENYVYLENTTLEEFAATMERRFDLQIEFENRGIKNCQITGRIHQRSFKGIMDIVCESLGLKYAISERIVMISGGACVLKE